MLSAILAGFALSAGTPWAVRVLGGGARAGAVVALFPLGVALWLASLLPAVAAGQALSFAAPWVPSLGIELALRADGLALLFALAISGVGALVFLYAGAYLAGDPRLGRLLALLLAFLSSMLGLVLADDAITLFVFWEATSITSYLLIGFDHEDEASRKSALQALLVTGGGGLALLAGLVLLGLETGTYRISAWPAHAEALAASPLAPAALGLVLLGAFTKSAQAPFHFWLPNAMAAPTPVSAYLHSATMVKAGVYLLARLQPALGGFALFDAALVWTGGVTMVLAAFLAVQQTDLKRILAYTTVAALGTLVLFLGIGTPAALAAATTFLLTHVLYKGGLFLVAGAIDHETGTRDVRALAGLRGALPRVALSAALLGLSMAGLPPLVGFVAKEVLYKASLESAAIAAAAIAANALTLVAAALAAWRPFFARPGADTAPAPHHDAPLALWLGPAVLGALGLLFGLAPGLADRFLVSPAASAAAGAPVAADLHLWAGVQGEAGVVLGLSALTIALGLGLAASWERWRPALRRGAPLARFGPERAYDSGLAWLLRFGAFQTRLLQSGYLRYYLIWILGTMVTLTGFVLATRVAFVPPAHWGDVRPLEAALALLMIVSAVAVVRAKSRLAAVIALGVVGYAIAVVFILFGGPDLAMTQFAIETLSVVLFMLVLYRLPRFANTLSAPSSRARDLVLSAASGAVLSALVLAARGVPTESILTPYFAENSLPVARGRNVVNVILVDFRGFDTLGEITVLAIAAVGIAALLRLRVDEEETR